MADLKTERGVLRALLADAIRAHHLFNGRCVACGEKATHQSLHQADVLLGLSGVAVTQLPDLHGQLPQALIEDAEGVVWQLRKRVYGASWYRPGDRQPHGVQDIALPATLIRAGWLDPDDEVGE